MNPSTPLEELIKWLNEIDNSIFALSTPNNELRMIKDFRLKASEYLEKEKIIIEDKDKELAELRNRIKELEARDGMIIVGQENSTCDVCGKHPSVIISTPFGRFCQEHARYI